ncbi:hypothetical protein POTOM_034860 [Populus tomentosa]|uniref:Uncharacterized protein n=1 Tax=Populus tomentosa TaxID=118781 RepID=A0A8X8CPQ0_POPTO|nr:hypothetical protein POTOM_034860 [Populus tomentosa]
MNRTENLCIKWAQNAKCDTILVEQDRQSGKMSFLAGRQSSSYAIRVGIEGLQSYLVICHQLTLLTRDLNFDGGGDVELNYDRIGFSKISLPHASYAKAVETLLCSHEFKLAIRKNICSIPEGQASQCIPQLTVDLSESMEWMKCTCSLVDGEVFGESSVNCSMHGFDLQVELSGRGLSEIYVLVLDSLNVTVGNSSIVGRTIKDLMAVIRPYISILLIKASNHPYVSRCIKKDVNGNERPIYSILCEGLDGENWLDRWGLFFLDCPTFSLSAIIQSRLVDLNRQIKSLEYMQQSNDNFVRFKLLDDAGSSLYRERSRKWNKHITAVKQEAADLTGFMMSYLSLLINEQLPVYSSNAGTCLDTCNQAMHESDKWVLDVCSVIEKSLPAAIWWIIFRNIDIWSIHASKKKSKMFLKHAILTSLPSITKGCTEVLEKSVLPLFGDIELNASPKWQEDLSALENSYVVSGRKSSTCDEIAVGKSISHLLFVIGHLLECGDSFFSRKQYELLRLLVTCRKALKYLIIAYCEEKIAQSSLIPILSEDVRSVLWLSKSMSVVFRLQETLSEDNACEVTDMIFSLMDQTSYVFLTLSKYQCICAVDSIIAERPCTELPNSDVAQEQSSVNKSNPCLDTSKDFESWKSVIIIA